MKILTQLRFYVVVATLSFTGLLVNYFNKLEELRKTKEELVKCQTDNGYIPGGDIEKVRLTNQIDSLQTIIQEKVTPKEHFDGVTEMILDNYIDEKFLNEDAKEDINFVSKYTHQQRVDITNELKRLNLIYEDWYTTLEVYRSTNPKAVEEIEKITGHYSE
jgi:hypothetical protein